VEESLLTTMGNGRDVIYFMLKVKITPMKWGVFELKVCKYVKLT
jgi:hypothetical protein